MKNFLLLFLLTTSLAQAVDAPAASISVDASKILGPVNRLDFGFNVEGNTYYGFHDLQILPWTTTPIRTGQGLWDPINKRVVPNVAAEARAMGTGNFRFPGGCLAHSWDWKKTVGPILARGQGTPAKPGEWTLGLDEFMDACKELNVEPTITCSDYALPVDQMPQNLADLVEYLNCPATPDHPWAMKRAEWGHPQPWHVKWFELGNESWHGNHALQPRRQFSVQQYADYCAASAKAMKAVDPTIKVGIAIDGWPDEVLKLAGPMADFVIIHTYAPTFNDSMPVPASDANLMLGCMAASQQTEYRLAQMRQKIRTIVGHDLPLAITEYNTGMLNVKPEYRFTLAAALESADMLRFFLQPETNVVMADYFLFINGWMGAIKTQQDHGDPNVVEERPAGAMFHLFGSHFGSQLLATTVDGPRGTYISDIPSMDTAQGPTFQPTRLLRTIPLGSALDFSQLPEGLQGHSNGDGTMEIDLTNYDGWKPYPLGQISIEPRPSMDRSYRLNFDGRVTIEGKLSGAELTLADVSGKGAHSSASEYAGAVFPDWHSFSRTYHPSPQSSTALFCMFQSVGGPVSGTFEIKNLRVEEYASTVYPAYPLITSTASSSPDGSTLYVILFNKSDANAIQTNVALTGFKAASAKLWQVTGPALDATTGVKETTTAAPVPVTGGSITLNLPPYSMSALEVYRAATSAAQVPGHATETASR